MATKIDPRESQHGEEEERPLFGDQSQLIDPEQADELQSHYDTPDAVPLAKGSGPESPRALLDKENSGGIGSTGKTSKKESSAADKLGKGFSPADAALPPQAAFASKLAKIFMSKKGRAGIAGGGVAGFILFFMAVAQGPFQLIHIAQLLQDAHFSNNEAVGDITAGRLYRFIRSGGDVGETRIGWYESRVKGKMLADLKAIGLEPYFEGTVNTYEAFDVDTRNRNSPYYDMTEKEVESSLKRKGYKFAEVNKQGTTVRVYLDSDWTKGKSLRLMVKELGKGEITAAIKSRPLKKYGWVNWHPLNKIDKSFNKKAGTLYDEWREKRNERRATQAKGVSVDTTGAQVEDEGGGTSTTPDGVNETPDSDRTRELLDTVKNQGTGLRAVGGVTAVAGITCAVKAVDDQFGMVQYAQVVKPVIQIGMDVMTAGFQIMSGVDIDMTSVDFASRELNEKDKTGKIISTWNQSKANNAEIGKNGGVDLDEATKKTLNKDPPDYITWARGDFFDGLCSTTGQVATGVVGAVVGVLSGGTISTIVGAGAGVLAGPYVIDQLVALITGSGIPDVAGSDLGNLAHYGTRYAANGAALQDGGVKLSDSQTAALDSEQEGYLKNDFASRSVAEKLFDLYDRRSLASTFIDSTPYLSVANSPQIFQSFSGLVTSATSLPSRFIFSAVSANTSSPPYNYGFEEIGTSIEERDNDLTINSGENDAKVGPILDASAAGSNDYIDRAKKCFNVEITKESEGGWNANLSDEDEEFFGKLYTSDHPSNCDDKSEGWQRVRAFIRQVNSMKALACYYADEEACAELLAEGSSSGAEDSGDVGVDGDFAFPIKAKKSDYGSGYSSALTKPTCQNSGGSSSCHHDYFAADLGPGEGSTVVAAKAGTVRQVTDPGSCDGGIGAPRLHIEGSDGKWYFYQHLKPGSITVGVGDSVETGQELGKIGPRACAQNTDPHLHFDVTKKGCENSYFGRPGAEASRCLIDPMPSIRRAYEKLPD